MAEPLVSILIPYYNEADFIGATLASFAAQTDRRFVMVLVDNGSSDESATLARTACAAMPDIEVRYLSEPRPGKLHALATGMTRIDTPYLATCDADTLYPHHYVATLLRLFAEHPDAAGVHAIDLYAPVESPAAQARIAKIMRKKRLFKSQCHAGAYAQAFDCARLERAGGLFDAGWPYVLEDHEVIARLMQQGPVVMAPDHYCHPSERRVNRDAVNWTWGERMIYRFTPAPWKLAFFRKFLCPRFAARNLYNINLRDRDW